MKTAPTKKGGDDEPSLGWSVSENQIRALEACADDGTGIVDAEHEHGGREPSLGSVMAMDQGIWADGARDDREQDAGGEEEKGADDDLSCNDPDSGGRPQAI